MDPKFNLEIFLFITLPRFKVVLEMPHCIKFLVYLVLAVKSIMFSLTHTLRAIVTYSLTP